MRKEDIHQILDNKVKDTAEICNLPIIVIEQVLATYANLLCGISKDHILTSIKDKI